MNIKDDKTYSLQVIDAQMLVTTYLPEYTIFGVSHNEYTVRPNQIDEALTTEQERDLPICNFEYLLLYDEKADGQYFIEQTGNGVYRISQEVYEVIEGYVPIIIDEQ